MKLTWYGHACFLVRTAEGSVVFDPYAPGSVPGLRLPPLTADAVSCCHAHSDHGWAEGVHLTGNTPRFTLRTVPCFHDGLHGALRGRNRIAVLEAEGLRVVHLGDLGHPLSAEQIREIGRPDLLLIPVGGHFTIDAAAAAQTARALGAKLTVPMHYRGSGFGYDVIAPVDDFAAQFDAVRYLESSELDPASAGEGVVILRCPAA